MTAGTQRRTAVLYRDGRLWTPATSARKKMPGSITARITMCSMSDMLTATAAGTPINAMSAT
jgi:hypothetical protein